MPENDSPKPGLDRILCKKQLQAFVPYTSQHIARLEKEGKFPKRLQLGPNRVGWLESEIVAWIEELKGRRNRNGDGSDDLVPA